MSVGNTYKPRYTLSYLSKSKVWPYKNSRLRRFFTIRGRRIQRGGLFRRYVIVFNTLKWTEARRQIRPTIWRSGYAITGGGVTAFGRPRKRSYRDSFYIKQQLRTFHGKVSEQNFKKIRQRYTKRCTPVIGSSTRSFVGTLTSRLDRILFRIRFFPTIYACHQFIRHTGISVNGSISYAPQSNVIVGDSVSLVPLSNEAASNSSRLQIWRSVYWDSFVRIYYRRWGSFITRRRLTNQFRAKVRSFARSSTRKGLRFNFYQIPAFRISVLNSVQSITPQFRRYIKLQLALRLRSSLLPRSMQRRDEFSYSYRSRRKALLRFYLSRRGKVERRRKFVRLQPVHFIIPNYLHLDTRTLRAVLIEQPTSENTYFSFRGSVRQVQSFYRSRAFLKKFHFSVLWRDSVSS